MSAIIPLIGRLCRNQYQTDWHRYLPIPGDTHGPAQGLCQNGPKMEVSGAIPTLASSKPFWFRLVRTAQIAFGLVSPLARIRSVLSPNSSESDRNPLPAILAG